MAIGLVGKKCGMSRIFLENGTSVPVTVVAVEPNRITQIKTQENDGYCAIQVTTGSKMISRINKPTAGHFTKANIVAGRGLWEFRLLDGEGDKLNVGAELKVDLFKEGQKVDVIGLSKGKGFAGGVKRHNFSMQDATHGNSLSHRAIGSAGQCQDPGRVFKGKRMPGHLGHVRRTVSHQEIVRIDSKQNLLLIIGTVPGAPGADVIVRPTTKQRREKANYDS